MTRKTKKNRKRKATDKLNPPFPSRRRGWMIAVALGLVVAAYSLAKLQDPVPNGRDRPVSGTTPMQPAREETVPPFHEDPNTAKPFPETLSPSLFHTPAVARAYQVAGEIPEVLAQQPCYCYCDGYGHGSLLDCYASYHGSG